MEKKKKIFLDSEKKNSFVILINIKKKFEKIRFFFNSDKNWFEKKLIFFEPVRLKNNKEKMWN